jgi:hypothetical protein
VQAVAITVRSTPNISAYSIPYCNGVFSLDHLDLPDCCGGGGGSCMQGLEGLFPACLPASAFRTSRISTVEVQARRGLLVQHNRYSPHHPLVACLAQSFVEAQHNLRALELAAFFRHSGSVISFGAWASLTTCR